MDNSPMARPWGMMVVGGLLLSVGLVCFAFVVVSLALDLSLWLFGQPATATVIDRWVVQTNEPDAAEYTFNYYLSYRFETDRGQVITETTRVSAMEWAGLGTGGQGRAGVDIFDDQAVQAAAPVYQEQKHIPQETLGGTEEGDEIAAIYFPPVPSHNRLEESNYVPILACAYVPFFVLGVIGIGAGWRLIRPAATRQERAWFGRQAASRPPGDDGY